MFSGGQDTTTTLSVIQSADIALCQVFEDGGAACSDPLNNLYTSNRPDDPAREGTYDAWVAYASSRVYSDCNMMTNDAARAACTANAITSDPNAQPSTYQDISTITQAPLEFMGQFYTFASFFKKANELSELGVSPTEAQGAGVMGDFPIPTSVMNAINALTGGDQYLNIEIYRLYQEAMNKVPIEQLIAKDSEGKPVIDDIEENVGMDVVEDARAILQGIKSEAESATELSADQRMDFRWQLHMSYVDDTIKIGNDYNYDVIVVQMPERVLTELGISGTFAIAQVRRLFVQAEENVKEHSEVAAHLEGLDVAARAAFLNPIREQIADKIIEPIKIVVADLDPNQIATTLQLYDAIVDKTVENNGSDVTIVKIELVQREIDGVEVPELLYALTNAGSSILRYHQVARLWRQVVEEEPGANVAGSPLQAALVVELAGQIMNPDGDATTEDGLDDLELALHYVTDVNASDPANPEIQLERGPDSSMSPLYNNHGGAVAYTTAIELWQEALENESLGEMNDIQQAILGAAIRSAFLEYMREHAGERINFGLLGFSTLKPDGAGGYEVVIDDVGGPTGGGLEVTTDGGKLRLQLFSALLYGSPDEWAAVAEPGISYMHDFGGFLLGIGATLSFWRMFGMVNPGGTTDAFEYIDGASYGIKIKELPLTLGYHTNAGGVEHTILANAGIVNFRPLAGIDSAHLGDQHWWYATRDPAGSSRPFGLRLNYSAEWENGSHIDVQAGVGSGATSVRILGGDTTWFDGVGVGGAVGGEAILVDGHLGLGGVLGYNQILSGSLGGDSAFVAELMLRGMFGTAVNDQYPHSIGAAYRLERNSVDSVDFWEHTVGVNYNGVLFQNEKWQDELHVNASYHLSSGDMRVGSPDDFGNDCIGDDACNPWILTGVGNTGAALVVGNQFRFPLWYIDPFVALMGTGQDNVPNELQFIGGINVGILYEKMFGQK